MSEMSVGKEMMEKLSYKKKNIYEEASADKIKAIFDYAEGYMSFIDKAKTEREAVEVSIEMAEKCGFSEYKFGEKLAIGDKKYYNNHIIHH